MALSSEGIWRFVLVMVFSTPKAASTRLRRGWLGGSTWSMARPKEASTVVLSKPAAEGLNRMIQRSGLMKISFSSRLFTIWPIFPFKVSISSRLNSMRCLISFSLRDTRPNSSRRASLIGLSNSPWISRSIPAEMKVNGVKRKWEKSAAIVVANSNTATARRRSLTKNWSSSLSRKAVLIATRTVPNNLLEASNMGKYTS